MFFNCVGGFGAFFWQKRVWNAVWQVAICFMVYFDKRERQVWFKRIDDCACAAIACMP